MKMSERSWDTIKFGSYAELYAYAKEILKPQDLVFIGVRGYATPKDGSRRGVRGYRMLTPKHKAHELQVNTWTSNHIIVEGTLNTIGILQLRPISYTVEDWILYVQEANNGQKRAFSKRT
jgi:hypothetical protein